jgi:hypothetical protein
LSAGGCGVARLRRVGFGLLRGLFGHFGSGGGSALGFELGLRRTRNFGGFSSGNLLRGGGGGQRGCCGFGRSALGFRRGCGFGGLALSSGFGLGDGLGGRRGLGVLPLGVGLGSLGRMGRAHSFSFGARLGFAFFGSPGARGGRGSRSFRGSLDLQCCFSFSELFRGENLGGRQRARGLVCFGFFFRSRRRGYRSRLRHGHWVVARKLQVLQCLSVSFVWRFFFLLVLQLFRFVFHLFFVRAKGTKGNKIAWP